MISHIQFCDDNMNDKFMSNIVSTISSIL